jgi:hypothetical protein
MSLPATDSLISPTTESITVYSASWTLALGAINTTVNGAVGNSSGADAIAFWNADAFPNDQSAQIVSYPASSTGAMCSAVRCSAVGIVYIFAFTTTGANSPWSLAKIIGGVKTVLLSGNSGVLGVGSGDSLQLFAQGTTIKAFLNGSLVMSATDPSLSTGSAGIASFSTSTSAITSWQGAAAPFVIPVLPRRIFFMP